MADISLQLDESLKGTAAYGDILLVNGGAVLTDDVDPRGTNVVKQRLYTRLRLLTNEWFLDLSDGVPYFPALLQSKPSVSKFEAAVQNIILATPGVTAITSWKATINRSARHFEVAFKVTSTSGEVSLTVNLATAGGTGL